MQLKTDLQTVKNGIDSIDKYFLRIKHARDQLGLVGVQIVDEDIIVVTLNGLPNEYSMIKTVIRARDTRISLKDFHAQLIAVERDIEAQLSLTPLASMTAMSARGTTYKGSSSHYNEKGKGSWHGENDKQASWKDTHSESNDGGYKNFGGGGTSSQICNKIGHVASKCFQNAICTFCNRKGHIASQCFNNPASPFYRPQYGGLRNMSGLTPNFTLKLEVNLTGSTFKENLPKIRHILP
ncbi:hypothetical protein ACLB2K_031435 [Fragaria x ananassa]